ncbi:MAG: hypothetical protein JSU70_00275 [Phycisphaerales bacterium]|nr:MAG: hypothetical protein JSU70_00275 [Phycisphaerales bacterium]
MQSNKDGQWLVVVLCLTSAAGVCAASTIGDCDGRFLLCPSHQSSGLHHVSGIEIDEVLDCRNFPFSVAGAVVLSPRPNYTEARRLIGDPSVQAPSGR